MNRKNIFSLFKILLIVLSVSVTYTTANDKKNKAFNANTKLELPARLSNEWAKHNKIKPYIDQNGYIVIEPQISQPMIVCQLSQICILELATNEILVGENPVSIGLKQWDIVTNVYKRNAKIITSFSLRPRNNEGATSLAAFTNFGSHNILLIATSDPDLSMRKTRLADDPKNININIPSYDSVLLNTEKEKSKSLSERRINRGYEFDVNDDVKWKPITAYDDSVQTFIFLSKNSKNYNAVRVSSIKNDSEESVNYTFDAKNYILQIDGVYEKLYLTTNDEKAFVINTNY